MQSPISSVRRPIATTRESDELIFVVDIDGGVWGPDEIYGDQYKYGNLLDDGFDAILRSRDERARSNGHGAVKRSIALRVDISVRAQVFCR